VVGLISALALFALSRRKERLPETALEIDT